MRLDQAMITALILALVLLPAFVLAYRPALMAGRMPAYFNGHLYAILFEQEEEPPAPPRSAAASINHLYRCDACEGFVTVVDGLGKEPNERIVWREVQIAFNHGRPSRQFTSSREILAAVNFGDITLRPTDQVYRCATAAP